MPNLMVTLAPEAVSLDQIRQLVSAGIVVSLGHSDAGYEQCRAAFAAGARCATHLFNAMTGLHHRDPGLAGAALDQGCAAGVIADGIHVHPAAIRLALRAAARPDRLFLVSDAMAFAGTEAELLMLGGRIVTRADGALRLADGTLAGADLTLLRAIAVMVDQVGCDAQTAVAMATGHPAAVLPGPGDHGRIRAGARCDVLHLSLHDATVRHVAGVGLPSAKVF